MNELFDKIFKADRTGIKQLLSNYPILANSCDYIYSEWMSALQYAVSLKRTIIVSDLLRAGALTNFKNTDGYSLLSKAIIGGSEKIIALLLQWKADVNSCDKDNMTPLHFAARYANPAINKMLIEHGASECSQDLYGFMPIDVAIIYNNINLECYTKITQQLFYAIAFDKIESVREMLDAGADVNEKRANEATPLHWAILKGNYDLILLLLQYGAEVNSLFNSDKGNSALSLAPNSEIAELLISYGASIDFCDDLSPLQWAIKLKHLDVALTLINNGADIEHTSSEGETALHCAVSSSEIELVKLLIEKGANINAQTEEGLTPLHYAAWNGDDVATSILINNNAVVDMEDKEGNTPLLTVSFGNVDSVTKLLLKAKANPNYYNNKCETALHTYAEFVDWSTIHLLIEHGADVNAKTNFKQTPLHYWASRSDDDVNAVKYLLSCGSFINSTDCQGRTPLHEAAQKGLGQIVKLLVVEGADVNIIDIEGRTPLFEAISNGFIDITRYLLNCGAKDI